MQGCGLVVARTDWKTPYSAVVVKSSHWDCQEFCLVRYGNPNLAYISVFGILFVFSRLLFFAFSGVFSGDLGFSIDIHTRIHHHLSTLFLSVGKWPHAVTSGPSSAKFSHSGSNLSLGRCSKPSTNESHKSNPISLHKTCTVCCSTQWHVLYVGQPKVNKVKVFCYFKSLWNVHKPNFTLIPWATPKLLGQKKSKFIIRS